MGRGGGGGGKGGGGGGRAGRARGAAGGGGGGELATTGTNVGVEAAAGQNQIYATSPSQMDLAQKNLDTMVKGNPAEMEKLYADLPPVENANRKIVGDRVIVGDKGAPKVGNTMSHLDAELLMEERGIPNAVIDKMRHNYGNDGLKGIGELLKSNPNATYINNGVEGLAMNWSESRVIRIQYGKGSPPPSFNVGKAGAYPDWIKRYGGVAVEQKERIWDTAHRMRKQAGRNPFADRLDSVLDSKFGGNYDTMRKATLDKYVDWKTGGKIKPGDAHANNWGVDFKGRLRAIDPGAYIPPGADVTGAGW